MGLQRACLIGAVVAAASAALAGSMAAAAQPPAGVESWLMFDGVCNLCNGGVNLALDLDPPGRLRFAALQSDAGRALLRRAGRAPDDISSIVLVEERDAFVKSDAVLRIATYLENPLLPAAGTLGVLVPGFARDAVYDLVANNRYEILGMKDECRLSDDRFEDRFVGDRFDE